MRLALYLLFTRVVGHPEEGRYVELRRKWVTNIPLKFLAFFEFQALTCILLSVPFLIACFNPAPEFAAIEYAGMAIWAIAFVGEVMADAQLNSFKKSPANKGKTCQVGLWHYSRHPNYFFEWMIWVAYAVFALGSPYGWITLVCPALMLYFLLRVTGIPATEAQALRTKGDEYRQYQRTTSAFVPWFPHTRSI
jgi:steroid 5-alpha reductase family enzyme